MFLSPCAANAPSATPRNAASAPSEKKRRSIFLGTLRTFSVKGLATTEEVLPQGLKVRHDTNATMEVARPDHVRAEQTSDRRHRQIVYDGKTFTVYSKSSGYYAQAPENVTIYALAGKLEGEYAVELPLLDLFAWADDKAQRPAFQIARVVGLSTIAGVPCDQYAFRQEGAEWQVWIQRGAQPLPRRVVVTSLRSEARPQYTADYEWTLDAPIADAAFKFTPPAGAISVPLSRVKEIAVPQSR